MYEQSSSGDSAALIIFLAFYALLFAASMWATVTVLRKAGFSGWWALILFVPLVGWVAPFVFAFIEWPVHAQLRQARHVAGGGFGPVASFGTSPGYGQPGGYGPGSGPGGYGTPGTEPFSSRPGDTYPTTSGPGQTSPEHGSYSQSGYGQDGYGQDGYGQAAQDWPDTPAPGGRQAQWPDATSPLPPWEQTPGR